MKKLKLLLLPLICAVFLSALLSTASAQIDTSAVSMSGAGWSLKVDSQLQTATVKAPIQVATAKTSEKELSVIINDLSEVPDYQVQFKIQTQGLAVYKQLPLTEQEIKDGCTRPENVVNSFACYSNGKKVMHIYTSKLIDAKNNSTWVDSNLTSELLTVYLPKDWLENATFPVVLDPTFGYETAGSSSTGVASAWSLSQLELLDVSTTQVLYSISAYCIVTSGKVGSCAVYTDTGVFIAKTNNLTSASSNPTWRNFIFSSPIVVYAGSYFLTFSTEDGSLYYDASAGQNVYRDGAWLPTQIDGDVAIYNNRRYSIYGTYMEQTATPTPAPTASPTPIEATSINNGVLFLLVIIFIELFTTAWNRIPILNIGVGIIGFAAIGFSLGVLPFTPYSQLILFILSIVCLLQGGFNMQKRKR